MAKERLTAEDIERIIKMVKGSPMYPEDVKEKILKKIR